MSDESLRYPIGKFLPKPGYAQEELEQAIHSIETLPQELEKLMLQFKATDFDTAYRNGGWTGRQVIHHVADSHMNAYIRFKWTLTEDTPLIKAYDEKAWAETPETRLDPLLSIGLLKALHAKWVSLLRSLSTTDMQKAYTHPETGKKISLERMVALYAWHGQHHLAHLKIIADKSR